MDFDGEGEALRENQQSLQHEQEALRLPSINTELDLALSFCEIAVSTNDSRKATRNVANARCAYEAGLHPAGDTCDGTQVESRS
jgi:hypothetical protein